MAQLLFIPAAYYVAWFAKWIQKKDPGGPFSFIYAWLGCETLFSSPAFLPCRK
ncbi:hypothetical protein [Neobacillus terrae]|uniref:hypothetical protein n=1 Tax=Neobacillus terrae TaxID=3034837 RepID=UPI0023DD67D5|nr:hypothetical protein [Neobacillus terrae]